MIIMSDILSFLYRLEQFRSGLFNLFASQHSQSLQLKDVYTSEVLNRESQEGFTQDEVNLALSRMEEANQVMVSEGFVYLI